MAGVGEVIWGKAVIALAFHLAPEKCRTRWFVLWPACALNDLHL
jgi:hypothetical protein